MGTQEKTYGKLVFFFNMCWAPEYIYYQWGREKRVCFAKITHRQILDNPHTKPPARQKPICKLLHLIFQVMIASLCKVVYDILN